MPSTKGQARVSFTSLWRFTSVLCVSLSKLTLRSSVRILKCKHKVHNGPLLDVVFCERAAVLQSAPGKNEALSIHCNAVFVEDLLFQRFDAVAREHLQRDQLACKSQHTTGDTVDDHFSELLHATCHAASPPPLLLSGALLACKCVDGDLSASEQRQHTSESNNSEGMSDH